MNDSRFKCIREKNKCTCICFGVVITILYPFFSFLSFFWSFSSIWSSSTYLFCRFIRVSSLLQHFIPFWQSICFLLTKIIYFNKVRWRRFGGKEKLIFLLFPITHCSFSFPIVLQSYAKFLLQRQTKQLQMLMVSWKSPKTVFYFLIW